MVADLDRAVRFYRDVVGLALAQVFQEAKVAFFWIGSPGKAMLGLWESGSAPQRMILHTAFSVELAAVIDSPRALRAADVVPLDFDGNPTSEPVVLAWMPAAAVTSRIRTGISLSSSRCCKKSQRRTSG
jgi:lactoylglutathione lyase